MVEAMIRGEQGGYLHPNAAAAIPKVFGVADFQPYRRPQQAIGGASAPSASAGAPPIPAAPSAAAGGGAPSAGAPQTAQPLALVPRYDPATLMARPTAALGPAPAPPPAAAVPPGAQTYAAPPQPPPVNYAALVQPQYALAPSSSGLFG
jgi:hypothetical protein